MAPDTSTEITIPLDTRVLGEFIADLLGQRRIIERTFADRRFEIDMSWLTNLDQIIEQRLAAQNAGQLMSFSARIYFANGKIVILESQRAFRSFNDMSNELSIGVDLRWTYLIQFPLSKMPEKQEIRFSAFTDKTVAERASESRPSKSFLSFDAERERLSYGIQFTDVTWGEDLSAHIANYITSKTEAIPKWKHNLRGIRSTFLFPVGMMVGIVLLTWSVVGELPSASGVIEQYGPLKEITNRLQDNTQKLNFLVDITATRMIIEISLWPLVKGGIAFISVLGLFYFLLLRKASFISMNDTSRRYLEKYGKNFEFIRYGIGAALVVATIGGLFSSRLYDLIKPWL
jgi:hypothetical protein